MSLRDTMNHLNQILMSLTKDLAKATNGNKAAAQRVRTGTIKLERVAKQFRKESVNAEKSGQFKRKPKAAKGKSTAARKKAAAKKPLRKKR